MHSVPISPIVFVLLILGSVYVGRWLTTGRVREEKPNQANRETTPPDQLARAEGD